MPSESSQATTQASTTVARLLQEHGDVLWRFVLARTRSQTVAEDVVQETLLAALKAASTFSGQSTERTWLLGIANHKVSDHFRKTTRRGEQSIDADGADAGAFLASQRVFAENGHWRRSGLPAALDVKELAGGAGLRREELLAMLRACLDALPANLGEVVWLRDVMGIAPEEVCKQLGLSATNMWTRAHRARAALRNCIQERDADSIPSST